MSWVSWGIPQMDAIIDDEEEPTLTELNLPDK